MKRTVLIAVVVGTMVCGTLLPAQVVPGDSQPSQGVPAATLKPDAVILSDVPLAAHDGEVPRRLHGLSERDALVVQPAAVAGEVVVFDHVPDAGLM